MVKNGENFLIFLEIDKSYSDNTISTYLNNLKIYKDYIEENRLDEYSIEPINLEHFITYLKENFDYKPKSINTMISSLKSYYNFLLKEKYIDNDPTDLLKSPKIDKKYPTYLTNDELNRALYYGLLTDTNNFAELKRLLLAIDTSKNLGKRDYLLINLLYDSGVRVSELINIRINNIDFENRLIKILGKGDKERVVYFTINTSKILYEYIYDICEVHKYPRKYLFENKSNVVISRFEVYNIIRKYAELAKIEKKVTPHVLRHTIATHLIQNDADVMSVKTILGHSKVSTTEIYTHLDTKDLKRKYDAIKERKK